MKLILASQSPRRKELLRLITQNFEIKPSNIDESIPAQMLPEDAVRMLSHKKASSVSKEGDSSLVLGSDTVIVFGKDIIGKPNSDNHARQILRDLSGNEHVVMTGITIVNSSDSTFTQETVSTVVKFRQISDAMLEWYIRSGEHRDKAGGYAIQGKGGLFVDSIKGCYYNIVGFPINTILKMLESLKFISYEMT